MNETKIEWCDMSWNPITGCLHGCNYCYARRMAKRFSRGTGEGVNPPAYYIPGAGYIRDTEHNSSVILNLKRRDSFPGKITSGSEQA